MSFANSAPSVTAKDVREALLNLYTPTALAKCSLAEALPEMQKAVDPSEKAQLLRDLLLDTIAQLRPIGRAGVPASASRAHECLTLRYVSGLAIDDVAEELALSVRQVYRDLRWAEERMAEIIGLRRQDSSSAEEEPASDAIVQELQALAHKPEDVSLAEVAQWAVATLAPLAARLHSSLRYSGPSLGAFVNITPGVLKEAIVQVLSAVVQSTPGSEVQIQVSASAEMAQACVPIPPLEQLKRRDLLEAALHVAEVQRLRYRLSTDGQGALLCLMVPLSQRRQLLVIEDNPSATALYERYLADSEWDMVVASDPRLAVDLAICKQAEAVVLDIMMPETDGWSVLQALQTSPETRSLPVVICSIVDDPELGLALGAAACLTKPVSRADFLQALRRVAPRRTSA